MGELISIKDGIEGRGIPNRQVINETRLALVYAVAETDEDLLACTELELTGTAKVPQSVEERISVFGVDRVKRDVQLFHDLNDFEFSLAQRLCEAAIKKKIEEKGELQ